MTQPRLVRVIELVSLLMLSTVVPAKLCGQAIYEPDCNDPDAHDINCVEPTKALINAVQSAGHPYYIGHAEPTTLFFSKAGASGNNMQWKFKLPATEPASPTQNGSSVANFELYSTAWIGLELCDPNSNPYGACVAASDTNNQATAGAAFLELQFYPPGLNCSNTQWCVNLHINTWQDKNNTQIMNCNEPTTAAYVTTDGTTGGPKLLMNNGDTILVTLHDTPSGLRADVNDVSTASTGFMVASGANGYVHNANQTDCTTAAFNFHPMFMTASQGLGVPWAALGPNVSFDFEIGHFELCKDSTCSAGNLPDGDSDDVGCGTTRGVGNCTGADLDHNGTSYQPDWPDGTAAHPATLILGSPSNNGVGPLGAPTNTSGTYNEVYTTITFKTTEATTGNFYPFWSQAGTGSACVFNFGNDIPGTTTNDFSKAAQYGTTISNPCLPVAGLAPTISKSFSPTTIQVNGNTVLTFVVSNPNPSLTLTGVAFSDTLPAGLEVASVSGGCGGGTITTSLSSINLSGATLAGGGSCTFSVTVTGLSPGTETNMTGAVSSDETADGNTAAAAVTVVSPPTISKSFAAPKKIVPGGTIALSFTVTNPNSFAALPGVGFTDTLPTGLVVATPNGLISSGPCAGGVISAVAGSGSITLSSLTLAASTACTFSVNVTAPEGIYLNTTGAVFSAYGSGNTASDTLSVASPAKITKAFQFLSIPQGASSNLTFTLTNPNQVVSLTGIAFTDTLPSGLVVSTPNGLTTTCGGTVTAVAGSNSISATGVPLAAPGGSCTITVAVTATGSGVQVNTTGTITSDQALPGDPATATIVTGDVFEISYASNLTAGDSEINITNTGANGASLFGPGVGNPTGNICVNVYAFAPDEQLVSCCSCLVTPNGLVSLSVERDIVSNTLTSVRPSSIVVKLVSTLAGAGGSGTSCTNSAATPSPLAPGLEAWRTSLHATVSGGFTPTETPFSQANLSAAELASAGNRCTNIIGNGSSFGICRSCRAGGLGAERQF